MLFFSFFKAKLWYFRYFQAFGCIPRFQGGKCIRLCPYRWLTMSERHLQEWPPRHTGAPLRGCGRHWSGESGTGVMRGGVKLSSHTASHVRLGPGTGRAGSPGRSSGLPVMPGAVTSDMLFCARPRRVGRVGLHWGSGQIIRSCEPHHHSQPSRTRATT